MIKLCTNCGECVKQDVCCKKEEMMKKIDDINTKYAAQDDKFLEYGFTCKAFYKDERARMPEETNRGSIPRDIY